MKNFITKYLLSFSITVFILTLGFRILGSYFLSIDINIENTWEETPDSEKFGWSIILNIVYFCYFLLVINYFVFTYNLTIYYARKYKKGAKGAKGKIGSKGLQGKSTGCDICTQKSGTFKREDESTPKEIVDNSLFKKLNTSDDKESKWKVTNTDSVKNINLGIKNDSLCRNKKVTMPDSELLNDNCSNDIHTSNTYLNGAIVGFNNVYGDLYSLQFMEDANLEPNKNKSNNNSDGDVQIDDENEIQGHRKRLRSISYENEAVEQ